MKLRLPFNLSWFNLYLDETVMELQTKTDKINKEYKRFCFIGNILTILHQINADKNKQSNKTRNETSKIKITITKQKQV